MVVHFTLCFPSRCEEYIRFDQLVSTIDPLAKSRFAAQEEEQIERPTPAAIKQTDRRCSCWRSVPSMKICPPHGSLCNCCYCSGLIIWVVVDYSNILRLRAKLPPGPFPLPLLGNYFHMRMKRPWEHWEKLANDFEAPLMTLWNGYRPVLVCSDAWTVADLFEKRAATYSSRPQMVMMGDMSGATENNQVCLKYDDKWRYHRRLTVGTNPLP